jgi:hypothetical protein
LSGGKSTRDAEKFKKRIEIRPDKADSGHDLQRAHPRHWRLHAILSMERDGIHDGDIRITGLCGLVGTRPQPGNGHLAGTRITPQNPSGHCPEIIFSGPSSPPRNFFASRLKILLPNGAIAVNPLRRSNQGIKSYDKKTFDGRGTQRTGRGLEQVVAQHLVVLGSGGAGFLLRTHPARLAEYVSQSRRRAARGF